MKSERKDWQKEIVAVRKTDGVISAVKFDNGEVMGINDAINLAKNGGIYDVNVGRRGNREVLKRNPVVDPSKALSNLPRF